jgi:hypothetical protein
MAFMTRTVHRNDNSTYCCYRMHALGAQLHSPTTTAVARPLWPMSHPLMHSTLHHIHPSCHPSACCSHPPPPPPNTHPPHVRPTPHISCPHQLLKHSCTS